MSKYNVATNTPIIGTRFGRWTVTEDLGTGTYRRYAVVVTCDCGNSRQHFLTVLKKGLSKSCGCYRKENAAALINNRVHKHNLSKHPLYGIWRGMKCRCHNQNDARFIDYGGRGIFVCDEWRAEFLPFYYWAMEHGWGQGKHIDRINNDKGYSPENCRFVIPATNMRNTRRNTYIEHNGESLTVTDWAIRLNMRPQAIFSRMKRGWPTEKILIANTKA
jgi:hypothetical protein